MSLHRTQKRRRKASAARWRRLVFEPMECRRMLSSTDWVLHDASAVANENEPVSTQIAWLDIQPTASTIRQPAHGSVAYSFTPAYQSLRAVYTPSPGFYGTDFFVASVGTQDGTFQSNVTIRVLPKDERLPIDTVGVAGQAIDPTGAVGPDSVVEMTNSSYTVWDKTGAVLTRTTLDDFWNNAIGNHVATNEKQIIRFGILASDPGERFDDSFFLSYGPLLSAPIQYTWHGDVLLGRIQSALDTMFGAGNTKASYVRPPEGVVGAIDGAVVEFCGQLAGMNMLPLGVRAAGPDLSLVGHATGGTFTLSFAMPTGTVTTAPIRPPYPLPPVNGMIQTALDDALGPGVATYAANIIEFADPALKLNPPPMTLKTQNLTGVDVVTHGVEDSSLSNESEWLTFQGSPTGGTFTLALDDIQKWRIRWDSAIADHSFFTTAPIAFSADASETAMNIQAALTATDVLGPGSAVVTAIAPFQFVIRFTGRYSTQRFYAVDAPIQVTADGSGLTGGVSPAILATPQNTVWPASVSRFAVEETIDGAGSEVLRLSVRGSSDHGVLALALGPQNVEGVAWTDSDAANRDQLQSKLEDLYGAGNVRVFEIAGGEFDIAFCGQLAGTKVSPPYVLGTPDGLTTSISMVDSGFGYDPVAYRFVQPQVIYDLQSGRWFASVLDKKIGAKVYAVSNTSSPLAGWTIIDPGMADGNVLASLRFDTTTLQQGNSLWHVAGSGIITWSEWDTQTNALKQSGTIGGRTGDQGLSFNDASIAVNAVGDVVIGMTGFSTTQSTSAVYVVGHTTDGVTTFGDVQVAASVTCNTASSLPSSYSSTVIDPTDPYDFWTFEEYVPDCVPTVRYMPWGLNVHQTSLAPIERPIAKDDNYSTKQDAPLIIAADAGVLKNDQNISSADSTTGWSALIVQVPAHGTLTLNADGSFIYVPTPGFSGSDSFTYWAMSGGVLSKTATVNLQVLAVDHPPTFAPGSDVHTTAENGPVEIEHWANTISAGPANEIGQKVHFVVLSNTNPALFSQQPTIDAAGTLRFVPKRNAGGAAEITFALMDDGGTTSGGVDTSPSQTFGIQVDLMLPWHNPSMSPDVTGDGNVVAEDAIDVINFINSKGSGPVIVGGAAGANLTQSATIAQPGKYYDVTGDDYVGPDDVITIINYINARPTSQPAMKDPMVQAAAADDALLLLIASDSAAQPKRRIS